MESETQLEGPVRVRLFFSDKHLLSHEQRAIGLRRCWAALRRETATVGQFAGYIHRLFGLRCKSSSDLILSIGGFVLPSFESTCMFEDKDLIRVETRISQKKKKKIAITDGSPFKGKEIIEKETVVSIDNGENSNHQKKTQMESEQPESSKKKLKLTPRESPLVINISNNNRSCATIASQNDGTISDHVNHVVVDLNKNKQMMANCQTGPLADGSKEKNECGPTFGDGVLGQPLSQLMSGQTNFMHEGGNNNTNSGWEIGELLNTRETQQESGWETWAPSNKQTNTFRPQMGQNTGGWDNKRNSGWEATQEAANGNEIIQTQETGWEAWPQSTSRYREGQNGNFGSCGGFPYRERNGRGNFGSHGKKISSRGRNCRGNFGTRGGFSYRGVNKCNDSRFGK